MAFTETTTDTFPKVEDYDHVMNMSGQRSPYTMPVGRQGPTTPDQGGGGAGGLSHTMIHEAHGPTFRPMATRGWGADYAATGRGLRTVPSSVGNRDFWDRRADQGGEVIG